MKSMRVNFKQVFTTMRLGVSGSSSVPIQKVFDATMIRLNGSAKP